MQNLGVRVANTTDSLGRSRFHCFGAEVFISGDFPSWFLSFDTNGAKRVSQNVTMMMTMMMTMMTMMMTTTTTTTTTMMINIFISF